MPAGGWASGSGSTTSAPRYRSRRQAGTRHIRGISMTEQYCSQGREEGGVGSSYHRPAIGTHR